ncbi:MAG: hypothetical protein QF886_17990 [Planctomycetota bacterium]|nr:hypothetical protein [Planctomycetota bacterium]
MFMTLLAWGLGIAVILLARRASHRALDLQQRVDDLTREYYGLSTEVSDLGRTTRHSLPDLQVQLLRKMEKLRFEPHMTIRQALEIHPDVGQVFEINSGGCSGSGAWEHETIREASELQGRELDEVMLHLNGLLDGTTKVLPKNIDGFVPLGSLKTQ